VGIVGHVANQRQPRIVHDVGEDAIYFNNPDLPETRSEMSLPLISARKVLGVLDIQSTQEAAFSQEDIIILQLLADQIAVAIDNAYLFAENQKALAETRNALEAARRAYRDLSREGWRDLARVTKSLAYRADQQGTTPITKDISPVLKHTEQVGHINLPSSDTLAVPIKIQDHIAGAIRLKKGKDESWSAEEVNLIETLTNQLGNALESARLYKETQTSLIRTEALYQIGRVAITINDTQELLQSVANIIAGILPAERVLILTLDMPSEKVLHFIENNVAPQEITPDLFHQFMNGLTGWAIKNRTFALSPKNIPDPRESLDAQKHRQESNIGSVMVIPMFYQDNVLGTITTINTQDQSDFSEEDASLLTAMANQVAATLTNTELLTQTRRRALQLQTSAEISRAASSILELELLLPQAVELIRDRFDLYYVGIFLADEMREWAFLRAGTGEAGKIQMENGHRLAIGGESMIGQCIINNKARIALDVGSEAIHFQNPHLSLTRSEMALPLNSRTGTIGAITIQSTLPSAFTQEDVSVFQTMADQLASAIDNAILCEANR
jgi:GAF domain-containing protein